MTAILIIDDSLTTTMSIKSALTLSGYDVHTANDGATGLALLDKGYRPDLIITDINMPGMTGLEVIEKVRTKLRFIPILALSAESAPGIRQEARDLGATGWLVKPIKPDELVGVIKKLVLKAH
ncbi:MAG: hypothetical protein RLZZ182_447 [Pseudomonadota bacterium]